MCKIILSACTPSTPLTPKQLSKAQLAQKVIKKLFKVRLMQDLSAKSGLFPRGLDLLTFLKACDYPSLLGERLFFALDADKDGIISLSELEFGITTVYTGRVEQTAELFFHVLDFNSKGYVTAGDVGRLLQGGVCESCGRETYPRMKESVEEMFKIRGEIDFENLQKCIQSESNLISFLREALIKGLPSIFDEYFDCQRIDCCGNGEEDHANSLFGMVLEEKLRYFEGKHEALYAYSSDNRAKLVKVILLRDLFVANVGESAFFLGNSYFSYFFQANSASERQKWIDFISSAGDFDRPLLDSYSIISEIATGATCTVFKAVHKLTCRPAAIKTINKLALSRKSELAIRREIRILREIDHPNVVSLYEVIESKEEISIVTELLSEGSLFDYIEKRNFSISEEIARKFAGDVCAGVGHLHTKGVIHRDLKLENLLLTSIDGELRVKVIDFGLAAEIGPDEHVLDAVGTLKYAAPEVLSRIAYREKADSWSFGVVLYVLLRGCMPFAGKTEEETALCVLKRRLHFSSDYWAHISPSAISLLSSLLSRDPRRRISVLEAKESEWVRGEIAPKSSVF